MAVYFDPFNPYSRHFCSSCFVKYIESKVLKRVPRKVRGHPIAVAVSGGKDSLALLNVLYTYRSEMKIPSISVFILEEEIPEIHQERQLMLEFIHKKYPDLPVHYVKYSDIYDYNLPDLVNLNDVKGLGYTPCTICGILRKHALFNLGIQFGVDFIALGTTLEDETATSILNIIRGISLQRNKQSSQLEEKPTQKLPQRIKPLVRVSEDLINEYIRIMDIPIISSSCPYADRSLRSDISSFISKLKTRDPQGSFLYNILKTRYRFTKTDNQRQIYPCNRCQMVSHQVLCPSCTIISKLEDSS